MQYLLMLTDVPGATSDDGTFDDGTFDDGVFDDWAAYTRALQQAGVLVGGAALHGVDTATTVQVRGGRRIVLDGPFADTKEHLIGYYVIDVADLDVALDWAARVPNVRTGRVEVRPIVAGSDPGTVLAAPSGVQAG